MQPQYFKGDDLELAMDAAGEPTLTALSIQKDLFFAGAFDAGPLGDLIVDSLRAPLANAISKDVFRLVFKEIFEAFIQVGTFEAYITVFKKIFGDDVDVEFTVSAPGKLAIDIAAAGFEISHFVARHITSNAYVFDSVVTEDLDNICFQTIKGFTSQYELEQMLFEMVPGGIFTQITLTVG